MSTRSNIAVKIQPKDYPIVNEKTGYNMTDENPYLEIYCHWDGYPEHMFNELKSFWNSYDKALELVLNGDTSSISKGVQDYYTLRGESYESNKPTMCNTPVNHQVYLYVFEDEWNIK